MLKQNSSQTWKTRSLLFFVIFVIMTAVFYSAEAEEKRLPNMFDLPRLCERFGDEFVVQTEKYHFEIKCIERIQKHMRAELE